MNKPVIIFGLAFLFSLGFISAISASGNFSNNLTLLYPQSAEFGKELNVTVILNDFAENVYDVKIEVLNNSTRIARIWNGTGWQSTYNYVSNIINNSVKDNESFRLNLTSCYNGAAEIQVRLKNLKNQINSFSGYWLNITGNCSINNPPANDSDNFNDSDEDNSKPEILLELDWDEEDIVNGKEFEIKLKTFNLEDKNYDVKVLIYDEDKNKPISQTYKDDKWVSSSFYYNEFFRGPGNKTKDIELRIKDSYGDFKGEAYIDFRIRETGSSIYKKEIVDDIEIKEKESQTENIEKKEDKTLKNGNPEETEESFPLTGEVIRVGKAETESIKSQKNIVYESKNELIKKYSIYGFVILLIIICILLVFKWIR